MVGTASSTDFFETLVSDERADVRDHRGLKRNLSFKASQRAYSEQQVSPFQVQEYKVTLARIEPILSEAGHLNRA